MGRLRVCSGAVGYFPVAQGDGGEAMKEEERCEGRAAELIRTAGTRSIPTRPGESEQTNTAATS